MFYVNFNTQTGKIFSVSRKKEVDNLEITEDQYIEFMTQPNALTAYWVIETSETGEYTLIRRPNFVYLSNPLVPLTLGLEKCDYRFEISSIDKATKLCRLYCTPIDEMDRLDITLHAIHLGNVWSDVKTLKFPKGTKTCRIKTQQDKPISSYIWYIEKPCLGKVYSLILPESDLI